MTHLSMTSTLRNEIIQVLDKQGFAFNNNVFQIKNRDISSIREAHFLSRNERLAEHKNFIEQYTVKAKNYMLNSSELEPAKIRPRLILVESGSENEKLFRWWNLTWWSLPFEKAYGRQMRFIIWDEYHNAPIGLIGLQSPILNWGVRDNYLSITPEKRDYWINQSMSAQRLGALPPYNKFLGGKLVAMLLASNEIRVQFHKKYKNYRTILKGRTLPANLLFITTTAAYGKSTVYNRLRFDGQKLCEFIGYSKGHGTFHIPNSLYEGFVCYLKDNDFEPKRSFGNGPSVKLKNIHKTMKLLGFENGVDHGIKRAVYFFSNVQNIQEIIHELTKPVWVNRPVRSLTKHWKDRWLVKRMKDYPEKKLYFSKTDYLSEIEHNFRQN